MKSVFSGSENDYVANLDNEITLKLLEEFGVEFAIEV